MSYENYELSQGWDAASFGSFSPEKGIYYSAELKRQGLISSKDLHVLDIGFGNGSFLGWCRHRGWQCDGVEINERLIERARDHGYIVKNSINHFIRHAQRRPYDLITAFDVLEHIDRESQVTFLTSLQSICTQRTLVMLRFPNGDNPFSLPIQNGDVTHQTAIGQMMLRHIVQLAGFEIVSLGGPSQPMQGVSIFRRIGIAAGKPLRWTIGTIIRHLFMGGASITFSSNLFAVLRKSNAVAASICSD